MLQILGVVMITIHCGANLAVRSLESVQISDIQAKERPEALQRNPRTPVYRLRTAAE